MQNYTKEQEAIRQAFANFVGSLLVNSMYDGEEARENVLAILCEELVKYTKDENETINTKTSRPILKSTLCLSFLHLVLYHYIFFSNIDFY